MQLPLNQIEKNHLKYVRTSHINNTSNKCHIRAVGVELVELHRSSVASSPSFATTLPAFAIARQVAPRRADGGPKYLQKWDLSNR